VTTQHATRWAIVPLLSEEPVGIARLLELAGSAFQAQGERTVSEAGI